LIAEQLQGFDRMVGILGFGDNHMIVRGPLPDRAAALALVRHWSLIQIGGSLPASLTTWRISTREFRESLTWAVVAPGDGGVTPPVAELLDELSARGIAVHNAADSEW
jgi:hypothetical protein